MRKIYMLIIMIILTACGARVDLMQRQMVYASVAELDYTTEDNNSDTNPNENTENDNDSATDNDTSEDKEEEIVINPGDSSDLGSSIITPEGEDGDGNKGPTTGGGNVIDNLLPPIAGGGDEIEGSEGDGENHKNYYRIPMVQYYTVDLKDGRTINVSTSDVILDTDVTQIRNMEELVFKGMQPKDSDIAEVGILKDKKNNTIYPIALMETGSIASSIPSGGSWGGGWNGKNFYGEFQGEKHAYDLIGIAGANVNLAQDVITGSIHHLSYMPADIGQDWQTYAQPLEGTINFEGVIKNQEWYGTASTDNLQNPDNQSIFKEEIGFTEGSFISPTGGEATHAVGHVTLMDENNQGLMGVFQMQHNADYP